MIEGNSPAQVSIRLKAGLTPHAARRPVDLGLAQAAELGQALVAEALPLQGVQLGARLGQALVTYLGLGLDQFRDLLEEPGVDLGRAVDLIDGHAEPQGLGRGEQPVRRRSGQNAAHRVPVELALGVESAGNLHLVEPGQAGFERAQGLL